MAQLSAETKQALANDKHWQYNKNFINWVVDVTRSSIKGGGIADEMLLSFKHRSLDSIIRFKDDAKQHTHRAAHLLNACRIIRGL